MSVHELATCTKIHQTHVKNNVESFFKILEYSLYYIENDFAFLQNRMAKQYIYSKLPRYFYSYRNRDES